MDKWFSVVVKFETIEEALELAHKLSDQGLKEITIDSSQWEEEKEENDELSG
jgi:2-keto-3-deoxy-6-phosphogluconate aldolase